MTLETIMTAKDLKERLVTVPDNALICLCVKEFPYTHLSIETTYIPPRNEEEVGCFLLMLDPLTDLAYFLERKVS